MARKRRQAPGSASKTEEGEGSAAPAASPSPRKSRRLTRSRTAAAASSPGTGAGSGGGSSPPASEVTSAKTPTAKGQAAKGQAAKGKAAKAAAAAKGKTTVARSATASPRTNGKGAGKKAAVKRSPSLKRSSSVDSLPEGWSTLAPDTLISVDEVIGELTPPGADDYKIVNWNVNGMKAFMKNTKPFLAKYLAAEAPDVLCLNEVKLTDDNVSGYADICPGYDTHFNCCDMDVRKGYSGTAIFTRRASNVPVVGVTRGMGVPEHDREGRVTTVELPGAYVVVAYVPNSGAKLDRLGYRTKEWDPAFRAYLAELRKKKGVVVVGDLNVAHEAVDLSKPRSNANKTPGFCDGERDNFGLLLHEDGFVDTWRAANETVQCFSYWSYRFQCKSKNIGWRLDYALASDTLVPHVRDSFIRRHIPGSDHCPIGLVLDVAAVATTP